MCCVAIREGKGASATTPIGCGLRSLASIPLLEKRRGVLRGPARVVLRGLMGVSCARETRGTASVPGAAYVSHMVLGWAHSFAVSRQSLHQSCHGPINTPLCAGHHRYYRQLNSGVGIALPGVARCDCLTRGRRGAPRLYCECVSYLFV